MKKIIIVLIALALILAGCKYADPTDVTTKPSDAPIPEITETPTQIEIDENEQQGDVSLPMITVSMPVTTKETTADDGTVIYKEVTQTMQLVMQDPDVADRIIVDFLNRVDHSASSSEETLQQAQNAYMPSTYWTPYLCSVTYAPKRIDQSVLSLFGNNVYYSGSAHATIAPCGANYNVVTGDVLTLGSIITDESAVDKLCQLTIEKLTEVADEKCLRDGFESAVTERFSTDESYDENWFMTTTGLCFFFDPYAIAPYSSGVVTVEIPYAELVGIIADAFFPPELDACSGTVITTPADNANMEQFTRISEVIIDAEAPMYIVHCDNTVQNIRITLSDDKLANTYTIFAAQSLGSNDAVVIQAHDTVFQTINIFYESNGESIALPLITE